MSPEFGVCASRALGASTGSTATDPPGRESGPGRRPPGEGQSRAPPLGTGSSLGACVSSSPAPSPRERGPAGSTWPEQALCPGAARAAHRGALGHTQGAWLLEGIRRASGSVGIRGRALVRSQGQHLVGDAWLSKVPSFHPSFRLPVCSLWAPDHRPAKPLPPSPERKDRGASEGGVEPDSQRPKQGGTEVPGCQAAVPGRGAQAQSLAPTIYFPALWM